jgi:hypothetical protein
MTHGALLEALQASSFIDDYRALAAQEMELDTDVETARQVLGEAFHKPGCAGSRSSGRTPGRIRTGAVGPAAGRYRAADRAYLTARSQVAADVRPST